MGKKEKQIRAHVYVSGRVHGVGFRINTKMRAEALGLKGWVKNLADGRIEAVFEGGEGQIEKVIDWMKKGPLFANVGNLEVSFREFKDEYKFFEIII